MASVAQTSAEPLFATVTFVSEDDVLGNTFRVPINGTASVRRLAKDAMQRLVLSRRNVTASSHAPAIVVTEVYVGGTGGQPKAEVFAQDCVTQVILVREEVVYMRLKAVNTSTEPSRLTSPAPQLPAPAPQPPVASTLPAAPADGAAAPAEAAVVHAASALPPTASAMPPPPPPAAELKPTTMVSASDLAVPVPVPTAPATAAAEPRPCRPGRGSAPHTFFAANYTSSPGKRPRAAAAAADKKKAPAAKRHKEEAAASAKAPAASAKAPTALEMQAKQAPNKLGEVEGSRFGWGPEAARNFADNYVSSPGKRVAARRRAAPRPTTAAPAAPPKPTPKAPVSRTLQYPSPDVEEGRTTVGHAVQHAIVVEETSPTAELPRGWGKDSLRFFDPNTYCDDPTKARLRPDMDLSHLRRQRRPTTP